MIVRVDIGRFDKNLDVAQSYGADLKKYGAPFLSVLDADGKLILNQETSSLESKEEGVQAHDKQKVLEFLEANQAPQLKAEDLYASALQDAKSPEPVQDDARLFGHGRRRHDFGNGEYELRSLAVQRQARLTLAPPS